MFVNLGAQFSTFKRSIVLNSIESSLKNNWVVLFDGICNLCSDSVQLIIKNDPNEQFVFAQLQSNEAGSYINMKDSNLKNIDSILLVTPKKIYTKSSAALKIASKLKGLYPLLYIFFILPKFIRDPFYDFIAKNRYRWFGKKEACWIPTPELKKKFL